MTITTIRHPTGRHRTALRSTPRRSCLVITTSTTYAIRVEGHLDDHWAALLGGLSLIREDDGTTTATVTVADQAQLHGVLPGLPDVGAPLIELRRTSPSRAAGTPRHQYSS